MSDTPSALEAKPKLSLDEFLSVIREVAVETKRSSIVAGIEKSGRNYSMVGDDELDSLDSTEMVMEVEEKIRNLPGFNDDFSISDDVIKEAKNVGELYRGTFGES